MDDETDSAGRPGASHISTLAASIAPPERTEWRKKAPVKTYSRKSDSPSSSPRGIAGKEGDGKSRYGRTRKLRPSADFLSTDRKVSQYMKGNYGDQSAGVVLMYCNKNAEYGGPRSTLPTRLPRLSDAGPLKCEDSSEVKTSPLDLAAPTCSETLEKPLALQEVESEESDSEANANSEYHAGDLVWAAVTGYPYWPAMITRDPESNVTYKFHGGRRKHWHVHFFGDRGFRGWVSSNNLFPFDLAAYTAKQSETLSVNESELTRITEKKAVRKLKKLFTIVERHQQSWNLAVTECQNLIGSTRVERLDYFVATYLTKNEPKMRAWSSNLSLANRSTGKVPANAMSKPIKRKRSWSPMVPSAADENRPKRRKRDVPSVPPFMMVSSPLKLPSPNTSKSPSTKAVLTVSQDAGPPLTNTPAFVAPINSPTKKQPVTETSFEKPNIKIEEACSPAVWPNKSKPQKPLESTTSSSLEVQEHRPDVTTPTTTSAKRGRPRKHPLPSKMHPKSIQNAAPKKKGRPRKYSRPESETERVADGSPLQEVSGSEQMNSTVGIPVETATAVPNVKVEKHSEASRTPLSSPPATVTRSGRRSVKPEVLKPTFKRDKKSATPKEEPLSLPIKKESTSPGKPQTNKRKQTENATAEKAARRTKSSTEDDRVSENADHSKPAAESEIAPKLLPKHASLFAGVKDAKLCSICFKGKEVIRCKGPCALYMHVECGDKPRFAPEPFDRERDVFVRRKSKKRLTGPGRGRKKKDIKCETDDAGSLNGSIREEIPGSDTNASVPPSSGTSGRSSAERCSDTGSVVPMGHEDESEFVRPDDASMNGFHNDLPGPEVDIKSEVDLKEPGIPEQSNDPSCPPHTDEVPSPEQITGPCSPNRTNEPGPEPVCKLEGNVAHRVDLSNEIVQTLELQNGQVDGNSTLQDDGHPSSGSSRIPTPQPEAASLSDDKNVDVTNDPTDVDQSTLDVADNSIDEHLPVESNFERLDAADSTTSDSSEKEKIACAAMTKNAKEKGWMCSLCLENQLGPCFACGKDEGERVRCKAALCGKVFHEECLKEWPQHSLKQNSRGKMVLNCPAHACHTCISDNPSCLTSRYLNNKLVRCMKCPTTYHYGNHCVPAGSEILTSTQIICSRHFRLGRKSLSLLNASWCFLCSVGGSLICCDLCPNAFHVECLKIPSPPEGAYICDDCETGRFPLYGEIVWAKLGVYRWWPARILFPQEIPRRLLNVEHVPGEFVVRFYGTYNYYWVNRGRVFLFHDGDGKKEEYIHAMNKSKNAMDETYWKAVREACDDFTAWNKERNHLEESHRPSLKPPKYTKITSNKPVGSVKMNEADASSLTACQCSPDSEDPCGPDSDCINRLLLVECDSETCPAKEKCKNRNFEKRLYPSLMAFRTESRGWGLKTLEPLKKGDFVIEYVGEMIDEEEYRRRRQEMQKNKHQNFYFLTLDKDRMLDAGPKGNLARFMNHSCQPNCETQKWTVKGNTRVGLFALETIPADTELVFNYYLMTTGDDKVECRCGAPNCAGYIGGKPTKPPSKKDDANNKSQNGQQSKIKKKKTKKVLRNVKKPAPTNSSPDASAQSETSKCCMCNEDGATVACQETQCTKMYHLACARLTKEPESKQFTCPSHECRTCSSRNQVENCSRCINSYCSEHQQGNIVINREKGPLCRNCSEPDNASESVSCAGGKQDETVDAPAPAEQT